MDKEEIIKLIDTSNGIQNYINNCRKIAQLPETNISQALQSVHIDQLRDFRIDLYKKYIETFKATNAPKLVRRNKTSKLITDIVLLTKAIAEEDEINPTITDMFKTKPETDSEDEVKTKPIATSQDRNKQTSIITLEELIKQMEKMSKQLNKLSEDNENLLKDNKRIKE
jgi:hypothetical protein